MSNALEQLRAAKKAKVKVKKAKKKTQEEKPVYRKGRPTQADKDTIRRMHLEGKNDKEIGNFLGRSEETVRNIRHGELLLGDDLPKARKDNIPYEIAVMNSPQWPILQKQFTKEELEIFKIEYARLMSEMKDDLRATDEINIFALIRHMLLIDRNYIERKRTMDQLETLEREKNRIIRDTEEEDDAERLKQLREDVNNINIMVSQYLSANTAKTSELKTLEERKARIQEQLKITRDQRISKLEAGKKETYVDLLVSLEDEEFRKSTGQMMELNKMAMYKELNRLKQPHNYRDGKTDIPILTAN